MKNHHFFKALLLVPFLKGCIYSPMEYYAPEGKGIYLENSVCGNSGPKDIAVLYVKDVRVYAKAIKRNESVILSVKVEIPEGHSVQFAGKVVAVDGVDYIMVGPSLFDYSSGKFVEAPAPLVGSWVRQIEARYGYIQSYPIQYHYSVTIPYSEKPIQLSLPQVEVDGSFFKINPISFLYKNEWFLTPFNC